MSEALRAEGPATIWIPRMSVGRGLNDRLHWRVRAKYVKTERGHVAWAFCEHRLKGGTLPRGPYAVRLTRVYSGRERELDDDNWVAAAKAVRDQVAAELGVNDGDRSAIWFAYDQIKGPLSGVKIDIQHTEPV